MVQYLYQVLMGLKTEVIKTLALQRVISFFPFPFVMQRAYVTPVKTADMPGQKCFSYYGYMVVVNEQLLIKEKAAEEAPCGKRIQQGSSNAGHKVEHMML